MAKAKPSKQKYELVESLGDIALYREVNGIDGKITNSSLTVVVKQDATTISVNYIGNNNGMILTKNQLVAIFKVLK